MSLPSAAVDISLRVLSGVSIKPRLQFPNCLLPLVLWLAFSSGFVCVCFKFPENREQGLDVTFCLFCFESGFLVTQAGFELSMWPGMILNSRCPGVLGLQAHATLPSGILAFFKHLMALASSYHLHHLSPQSRPPSPLTCTLGHTCLLPYFHTHHPL